MEVLPGVGIDKIKFEISQEKLIGILGKPSKMVNIEMINEIQYIYNDLLTTVHYWLENGNGIFSIQSSNTKLRIWGQEIIGIDRDSVIKMFAERGLSKIEYEDYGLFEVICYEEIGIDLKIKFNIVQSISMCEIL